MNAIHRSTSTITCGITRTHLTSHRQRLRWLSSSPSTRSGYTDVLACSFMARTPLETACWRRTAPSFKGLPTATYAAARSASVDRGEAEMSLFVGLQKCRALICFWDASYSFVRPRSETLGARRLGAWRPDRRLSLPARRSVREGWRHEVVGVVREDEHLFDPGQLQ